MLDPGKAVAVNIAKRLRFSQADTGTISELIDNRGSVPALSALAELKRFLRDPLSADHLALRRLCGEPAPDLPRFTDAELHPKPLLTGFDLIDLGYPQGVLYTHILAALEDAQLNGALADRAAAIDWLRVHF